MLQTDSLTQLFGTVASFNGATVKGILSQATVEDGLKYGQDNMEGINLIFSYATSKLPGLTTGSNINVAGVNYLVSRYAVSHLGEWSKAYLREV